MPHVILVLLALLLCTGGARLGAAESEPHPQLPSLVGKFLARDYYDPDRIRPALMLREALRAIEGGHVAIDAQWDGRRLDLHIGDEEHRIEAGAVDDLADVMLLLQRLQGILLQSGELDQEQKRGLAYGMLNGALRTLDPHTWVMAPEPAQQFSEAVIEGEFFGIGAYLSSEEGAVRIDRVMPGLPADMAGIKDDDVILFIDGETTAGLTLSEAVRRIKGPQGTSVALTLEREELDGPITVEVVRDRVKPVIVSAYRDKGIGYIRLDEFSGSSLSDLRLALLQLKTQSRSEPLDGLVLDLRFNGGGRLDKAHEIADLFLPPNRDVVVTVQPGARPDVRVSSRSMLIDVPMLVLVSSGSASAAEILAGSLQQNDRAVVVGQTTFGKGSVQTWRKLPDDSFIKFTIQEYQLADGVSIQGSGVEPDLRLTRHAERENGRIDMIPYTRSHEADEEFSLAAHNTYFNQSRFHIFWLQEWMPEEEWERTRISNPDFRPDQEARLAMDLLGRALRPAVAAAQGGGVVLQRQQLLDALEPAVAEQQMVESESLAERMRAGPQKIVWGGLPQRDLERDDLELELVGDPTVQAGSEPELSFSVSNTGSVDATRLYGVVAADDSSPFWESEILFGVVPVGESREGRLRLRVPPRAPDGDEHFTVQLYQEGRATVLAEEPVRLNVVGAPRPRLGYAWRIADADGDGAIGRDEPITIHLDIHNDGDGDTGPLVVFLRKEDNPFVQLEAARWRLDPLPAGGSTSIEVPLTVRGELTVGNVTKANTDESFELGITVEERFEEQSAYMAASLGHRLTLPLATPLVGARIRQPAIAITGRRLSEDGILHLAYTVHDDAPAYVAVFLGKDKVSVVEQDADEHERSFTHDLQLERGMNEVRIVAQDRDRITNVRLVRVWSPHGAAGEDPGTVAEMP
ncbi:MAG: S41 family peptidase [Planctomycetota bacterium]